MGSIRLIKGSDDVLREEVVVTTVDRLVGDGDRGLLVDEHAGPDYELAAVVDAANTMPFLTDRRIVVARHLARFTNADALRPLLDHLAEPLDTTDLVLVWERVPEPGSRLGAVPPTLSKALKAVGAEIVEADAPGKNREAWVTAQLAGHGLKLDRPAASLVAERLGENAGAVVELAERLAGIHGDGARLDVDDVEPWLGEAGGVPPWELTDAIDRGDPATALDRLQRMMRGGDRHALQVMATLHGHYARMLRLDGSGARGEKDAAAVLGLRGSTFPARKALEQGRRLGSSGIARAIGLLADADLALRGAQAWPDELVMEVLVARLAAANRRRGR
ncbi:MAG: DNA polymerase III subunit delta [Acidimicrobiales bacterium]|mgnify:CR=1 FL=1|nr:DNA polymerase III subunit delta [Acidimicrobiales bacterium]